MEERRREEATFVLIYVGIAILTGGSERSVESTFRQHDVLAGGRSYFVLS